MKTKYYTFPHGLTGWTAILLQKDEQKLSIAAHLDAVWDNEETQGWSGQEPIPFILIGDKSVGPYDENDEYIGYEEHQKRYPKGRLLTSLKEDVFPDIIRWSSTLEAFEGYNAVEIPNGSYRIISPRIKATLEKFHLPPHCFYPALVTHEITGETREYFLFHQLINFYSKYTNLYWSETEVYYIKGEGENNEQLKKHFPKGTFSSYEDSIKDYRAWVKAMRDEDAKHSDERQTYQYIIPCLIYQECYDIWYGLISEDVKKALENVLDKDIMLEGWLKKADEIIITNYQPGELLPQEISACLNKFYHKYKIKDTKEVLNIVFVTKQRLNRLGSKYYLPNQVTKIETSETLEAGKALSISLYSSVPDLETEQITNYKVSDVLVKVLEVTENVVLENEQDFQIIVNEQVQHFPKGMKIVIEKENIH